MITTKLTYIGKWLCVALASASISACVIVDVDAGKNRKYQENRVEKAANNVPKNIIMVISDGTGPAFTTAYRYFSDNPDTPHIESTILDEILVGGSSTYPHKQSGLVTDSAASATALATGVKSYNGAIGVDVNKQALETVLHRARKLGMKTGLAVTSHIVHATPASYMVANESRKNYAQIADSFYDDRINNKHLADIMLGAGWRHFIRDDRNLVEEFTADGYQYIDQYSELASIDSAKPVLGLFGDDSLPWALDDEEPLRLSKLAQAAVPYLENEAGYFLLLEASQVDWAGHGNDIASAMAEMQDLAATMEYLHAYVQNHPDTLVVLTADHSTGGLTLGANGDYKWDPSWLKNLKASIPSIAKAIVNESDKAAYAANMLGFDLTQSEIEQVDKLNAKMKARAVQRVLKKFVDTRSNTGWTTSGHTGIDVQVFAFGPSAELFEGSQDNVDIAKKIFTLLEQSNKQQEMNGAE